MKIKDNWKEVTVKEFVQLQALKIDDYETPLDYNVAVLSVLSGESEDDILSLPYTELLAHIDRLSFINTLPEGKLANSYVINGKKYNTVMNVKDLTAQQYIDYVRMLGRNKDNAMLHYILAIFLIEDGKAYNTEGFDVDAAAEEISEHFSLADAYALSTFFLITRNALVSAMQNYSASKLRRLAKRESDPEKRKKIKEAIKTLRRLRPSGAGSVQ